LDRRHQRKKCNRPELKKTITKKNEGGPPKFQGASANKCRRGQSGDREVRACASGDFDEERKREDWERTNVKGQRTGGAGQRAESGSGIAENGGKKWVKEGNRPA